MEGDGGRWRGAQSGRVPLPRGAEIDPSPSYTFVQLADTQFGMMAATRRVQWKRCLVQAVTCGKISLPPRVDCDEADVDPSSEESIAAFEEALATRCVAAVNALRPSPAFVAVCGDLVNAFPDDSSESGGELYAAQVVTFKRIFSALDSRVPLVCLCGNHDVGERPTRASLSRWRRNFGADHFAFSVGPDRFLVLNSQLYKDSSRTQEAAAAQAAWLDLELLSGCEDGGGGVGASGRSERGSSGGAQRRWTLAFSHIPPFISDPDEPDGYFPLPRHTRRPLLEKLARGGVSHWFCGHYHRNAGGTFTLALDQEGRENDDGGGAALTLEVVTTAAVGGNITNNPGGDPLGLTGMASITASSSLSGLRVVEVGPAGIAHRFVPLSEL